MAYIRLDLYRKQTKLYIASKFVKLGVKLIRIGSKLEPAFYAVNYNREVKED